jgi:hypothetical protein
MPFGQLVGEVTFGAFKLSKSTPNPGCVSDILQVNALAVNSGKQFYCWNSL